MGGGGYSNSARTNRLTKTYGSMDSFQKSSINEIFTKRNIESAMNPNGVKIRESRDSEEHPESLAIIIGLDVTGSMGTVPHHLVKEGLPTIMENILKKDIRDPQVLFLGIGDHYVDNAPLQVGQFESSDELLDKWLTSVYLEGGGGGNGGESYHLAWYFAALHTVIDCFEKRGKKGFLFTVGDEPVHKEVSKDFLKGLMGSGEYQTYSAHTLFEKASEKYNVYHIHISETGTGSRQEVMDGWRELLADHLIVVNNFKNVADAIIKVITEHANIPVKPVVVNGTTEIVTETKPEEGIML
jgi:hypothetical protein